MLEPARMRCPHCNAICDVEPHRALGFRCLVCGGPRIAFDVADVTPSEATQALLKTAGLEQTKHLMFSAAGFLLAGMGALALAIAAAVVAAAAPGLAATFAAYLAAGTPLAAGLLALGRAAKARRLRAEALRAAQVSALGDVQAVKGGLSAEHAGQLLRVGSEPAELLLAEASVSELLEEPSKTLGGDTEI